MLHKIEVKTLDEEYWNLICKVADQFNAKMNQLSRCRSRKIHTIPIQPAGPIVLIRIRRGMESSNDVVMIDDTLDSILERTKLSMVQVEANIWSIFNDQVVMENIRYSGF